MPSHHEVPILGRRQLERGQFRRWIERCNTRIAVCYAFPMILGWAVTATAATLPAPEVLVTSSLIIDYEFDWGRNGVYCASCNDGAGNSRLAFIDNAKRLWVAQVDFQTGAFVPAYGTGELVDSNAALVTDFANGPEWMVNSMGSQVVYTKYPSGAVPSAATAGVAMAQRINGVWSVDFLPGSEGRNSPIGTMDLTDQVPALHFQDATNTKIYWRTAEDASVEARVPVSGPNGGGRRWVPDTRQVILTGNGRPGSAGAGFRQVFLYDTETKALQQLTNEAANTVGGMMWRAPEYNNEYVFFAVRAGKELRVYRKMTTRGGGSRWMVVSTFTTPADYPYIRSPEYFVHNGKSYIFFELDQTNVAGDASHPNILGMVGILPENSALTALTADGTEPRGRKDPEYFITANGPYIYYNRYKLTTVANEGAHEGVYRVDTQLGPPASP